MERSEPLQPLQACSLEGYLLTPAQREKLNKSLAEELVAVNEQVDKITGRFQQVLNEMKREEKKEEKKGEDQKEEKKEDKIQSRRLPFMLSHLTHLKYFNLWSDALDTVSETSKSLIELVYGHYLHGVVFSKADMEAFEQHYADQDELKRFQKEVEDVVYDEKDAKSYMEKVYKKGMISFSEYSCFLSANQADPHHRCIIRDHEYFEIEPTGLYKIPLVPLIGHFQESVATVRYW